MFIFVEITTVDAYYGRYFTVGWQKRVFEKGCRESTVLMPTDSIHKVNFVSLVAEK